MTNISPSPAHTPSLTRAFTWVAIIEGCTWVGLLFGMYLKYIPETTEAGVRVFGPLHGVAFIAYVVVALIVSRQRRWPIVWTTLLALAAAVPPLMTVAFDLWARRKGLLSEPASSATAVTQS